MSGDGHALGTDTITLQTMLQRGYEAYARTHALADDVRRAGWAILACRTARLGGPVQACAEGHLERIWDKSCRHRMGPPCAWRQMERWLVRQQARRWACEHDPAMFTLPHARHDRWLANVAVMSGLLCARVHDTRLELRRAATDLGAQPGIIATRPPWSQTLIVPPHSQCVVTGGGRHASGHWVAVSHGCLRPRRVVMAVVRGQRRAAIRQGLGPGTRQWPAGQSQRPVEKLLHKLGRQQWNVPIRAGYADGQGVLSYLARSLRGGPASQRLVSCAGQRVVWRYEERANSPGG